MSIPPRILQLNIYTTTILICFLTSDAHTPCSSYLSLIDFSCSSFCQSQPSNSYTRNFLRSQISSHWKHCLLSRTPLETPARLRHCNRALGHWISISTAPEQVSSLSSIRATSFSHGLASDRLPAAFRNMMPHLSSPASQTFAQSQSSNLTIRLFWTCCRPDPG